ncbi:MAG: nitroreductase family protein [Prolixibacteraceae bacterium]|nr:nitroreductase family protein [Prolixibacteraceae bacterium]MBN2650251.1 nitroreductase family protein [Prolixibacteraceae bacterium]
MKFEELANTRHAVRKYLATPIDSELIKKLLDVARKAPSAVNFQPFKVFVVSSNDKLEALKNCYHRDWINSAPVIIVVVAQYRMGWKRALDGKNYAEIDAAIFIDHLMLQAAEMGLGTCWVGNFDVAELNRVLELKSDEEAVGMFPIGFPADDTIPVKKRKGLDEFVVWM